MVQAYISLGSNIGDPLAQLDRALVALRATPGIRVQQVSSIYRTAPWGDTEQPDFYNAVAQIETDLDAMALLRQLQRIEQAAGRERERRWGPRTLDLDLLLFADTVSDCPQLQLPHPRMHQRAFVLVPLAELAPDLSLGVHGQIADVLARVGSDGVELLVPPSNMN